MKMQPSNVKSLITLIPPGAILLVTVLAFPGFLSSDSTGMYLDAASHRGSLWFSLPLELLWTVSMAFGFHSYAWAYLLTNSLFAIGVWLLMYNFGVSNTLLRTLVALLVFACPLFIHLITIIQRDNLAIAALLVGFGLLTRFRLTSSPFITKASLLIGFFLLLLAAVARKDMAIAAIPILSIPFFPPGGFANPRRVTLFLGVLIVYILLIMGIYKGSMYLSHGKVVSNGSFVPTMHLDIVGISAKNNTNLYPTALRKVCSHTTEAIESYRIENLSPQITWRRMKVSRCGAVPGIRQLWLDSILQNPIQYIEHRIRRGAVLLRLLPDGYGSTITSGIHVNRRDRLMNHRIAERGMRYPLRSKARYPIATEPVSMSSPLLLWSIWIHNSKGSILFKPWLFGIFHLLVLFVVCWKRRFVSPAAIISMSGVFHFIAMSLLTPSAHWRYTVWFVLSGWISLMLCMEIFFRQEPN